MAAYRDSGNWQWEEYPPPFTWLAPRDSAPQPAPTMPLGLGCSSCGGGCGSDPQGMGYFASMDPSTWGVEEWGTIAAVLFVGSKVISSHPTVRKASKRARSAASAGTSGLGELVIYGALAYGAYWAWTQYTGSQAAGLGDYQAQGYTQPQILTAPMRNAEIQIPMGWS